MLKMTGINLELITDIDMFQMVEKGLRGGVSYIANRYSKPNNKYMSDKIKKKKKKKDRSYLFYLDVNTLYSWAMSQPLPTGGFKWLKKDKWGDILKKNKEGIGSLKKERKGIRYLKKIKKEGIGYFIECDLKYPKQLHNLYNGYLLAPEKLIVQDDWLSTYCKNLKKIWFSKR